MRYTCAWFLFSSMVASAAPVYFTNSQNQLLLSDTMTPGNITATRAITGLQVSENILGVDFRPATGSLYALGSSSRLYTIDTTSGTATAVGAAGAFTLNGTSFGFDFNPTVDRIRVTSDTGQNLRLNPIDGSLTAIDGALNPGTPRIAGSAYTNSFAGATTTTLYNIDYTTDQLFIQNPPNNGTQVLVGPLGIDTTSVVGFDIAYPGNVAYAALQTGGSSGLYTINLESGAATRIGNIGTGQTVTGLALAPVPEPTTILLAGLGLALTVAVGRLRRNRA